MHSVNSTRSASTKILTGNRLAFARLLWLLAIIGTIITAFYTLWAFNDYLHSGIADVSGTWNADNSAIILHPLLPETQALIHDGDLLLAVNGQPLPRRLTYTVSVMFPVYGTLGSASTVTIQTAGDSTPRQVTLPLTTVQDSNLNWLISTGVNRDSAISIWLVFETIWVLLFWGFALFLAWRRSDERVALLSAAVLFALGPRYGIAETLRWLPPYELPLQIFASVTTLGIQLVFLLLPNGRLYPRRFTIIFLAAYSLFLVNRYANVIVPINRVYFFIDIAFYAVNVAVQIYRYRTFYTVVQRQQMKWALIGIIIASGGYFLSAGLALIVGVNDGFAGLLITLLGRAAIIAAPIGVAIGIFRYRLYDADYILDRSVVFGTASILLAALFLGAVLLIHRLLPAGPISTIALIACLIAVGLLFVPTRRRVQNFIDRRFFRLRLNLDQLAAHHRRKKLTTGTGALSGTEINSIQFGALIGRGGMGEIYQAKRGVQNLAVKVLHSQKVVSGETLDLFERESQIMKNIAHPNIVHLVDTGTNDSMPYLAMEYVVGQPLDDYLSLNKVLPLDQTIRILRDIGAALDYIHKEGIVHRDIKPANVILQDMRAVLIDFGLAGYVRDLNGKEDDGLSGTLQYMSPEQIGSGHEISARADIYSLAVMAFQMVTGELPFNGAFGYLVFAHLNQPAPDPQVVNAALSSAAASAILRALSKNPSDRYASVGEFVAALAL